MLHAASIITLCAQAHGTVKTSSSAELVIDGKPTGERLGGYYLADAYQCDASYLLFMLNNDCYEEELYVHLVDQQGKRLDSACISWDLGVTGLFGNVQIHSPDSLSFDFFDRANHQHGTMWQLKLLPKLGFRLPLFCEPLEVHRVFGFKRHFVISAKPRLYPTRPQNQDELS